MGRRACCEKIGLKKGSWTAEEDQKLINFVLIRKGQCCWRDVPKHAGLLRCGKSCRLRWVNYLTPDLKRGLLSEDEEKLIIDLHSQLGNRWAKIASHMPGRTDNEIKNLWHTHIKKKLKKMGINPVTHKPLAPPPEWDESTITHDDQSLEAQENTTQNMHEKDKSQTNEGMEDSVSINNPHQMETNCPFSIDEVPLIEPDEFLLPDLTEWDWINDMDIDNFIGHEIIQSPLIQSPPDSPSSV